MNKQSNTYTIIYIIVLVVLVGTALAATSLALKDRQQENIDADKMNQILAAALITPADGQTVSDFNTYITDQYVVDAAGQRIDGVKAFDVNVANQSKLPADRRELPVYVCTTADGAKNTYSPSTVPASGAQSGDMWLLTPTVLLSTVHTSPIRARLPDSEPKSKNRLSATSSRAKT